MDSSKLETLLNCTEEFRKRIDIFKEMFIEYYGESERKYITERFSNALFCGYITDTEFSNTLDELEKNESDKLYDELLNGIELPFTKEQLFDRYSLKSYMLHPLYKYKKFYDEAILGEEGREEKYILDSYRDLCKKTNKVTLEEFREMVETGKIPKNYENSKLEVKKALLMYADISHEKYLYRMNKKAALELLKTAYPEITDETIEERVKDLKELNELASHYPELLEKFHIFEEKHRKFYDIQKFNEELHAQLADQYYREYLNMVIDYIPPKYREHLQNFINSDEELYMIDNELKKIIGYSVKETPALEYFGSSIEEKLKSDDTADWEKDRIISERIKYFKIIGIDLGSDYKKYAERRDIFPNAEKIDELIKKKKIIISNMDREYYNRGMPGEQFTSESTAMGFLEHDKDTLPTVFMKRSTCVVSNVRPKDGKYVPTGKVMINFSKYNFETVDHFIVHELNHLYELSLLNVTKDGYTGLCGWDMMEGSFLENEQQTPIELERQKRSYELFNEIINEKIAQEISAMMVQKGVSVFNEPSESKYENTSSYEHTNYLVSAFFETYKQEILQSRRDGNIQIILDVVGKENFDELNSLFAIHNENFGGFSIYNLLQDLHDKKETERVKLFNELKAKRDEILVKMKEHYESRNISK